MVMGSRFILVHVVFRFLLLFLFTFSFGKALKRNPAGSCRHSGPKCWTDGLSLSSLGCISSSVKNILAQNPSGLQKLSVEVVRRQWVFFLHHPGPKH